MRTRLHYRVLLWNIVLIGVTVGVLDFIISRSLRSYLEDQVEQQLERMSTVAAALVAAGGGGESVDAVTDRLSKMLGVRGTVIGRDGRVLGDSELDEEAVRKVENHGSRPEILAAGRRGKGVAIRYSATVHSNYMYVATRTDFGFMRLAMPLTLVEELVGELRTRLVYATIIALGLTLLLSFWVSHRISRPIQDIAAGAERLSTGDLGHRLPAGGDDEIAALASALNVMAENIDTQLRELSEGKRRLERVERMRRDFVTNVSHEFKTPLTSIRGYAETLLEGAAGNEKLRTDFLQVIERNARQLESLVSDLLVLAKIEAEPPAQKEFTGVESLVREQISARRGLLEGKNLRVSVDCAGPPILADPARLSTALSNLIDNAISYNREGGEIRIQSRRNDAGVFELTVTDTGQGIAEEEVDRIFERFYRVDKARSRESGGTGLGLAIAKHAIESQGGKITVQSRPGEGSTFRIHLAG